MVCSVLRRAGHRVALYTSPHLVEVRERMAVDGRSISPNAFAAWTSYLRHAIEEVNASFFEATTAIAFADFAARGADIAVIEVGLGGRLDSTNVIAPVLSAVTGIGLEHTDYLGDSLEGIAEEKAGIAKPGALFVIGETNPALVATLRRVAEEAGAVVSVVAPGREYTRSLGMVGWYQRRNAAIAAAILELLPARWRPSRHETEQGLATAWLPGRFDRRGKWLFDVAHNPGATDALAAEIRHADLVRPVHVLTGMLSDKDWRTMLATLRAEADAVWVSLAPSAPPDRRADLNRMEQLLGADVVVEPDFDRAMAAAQHGAGTVLVTGSHYTVGDALSRLPGFPPLG